MPEEHKKLQAYIDCLPLKDKAPSEPFAGLVYNLNVSTGIHRDWNDDTICVVVVISDCEGGDLLLVEPGLALSLQNGDAVIFKSADISHLNEHFKGLRASIVFHSDKEARAWVESRNGWKENTHFRF